MQKGQVVKLDRGYPLVRTDGGRLVRCEHATALVKGEQVRAVIGDWVEVAVPEGHDKGIIEAILPAHACVRAQGSHGAGAAPGAGCELRPGVRGAAALRHELQRLERELVLAYETGAAVTVVLTKADLAESEEPCAPCATACASWQGPLRRRWWCRPQTPRALRPCASSCRRARTAVLIGKSGVGKSSLVNLLVGARRAGDGRRARGRRQGPPHHGEPRDDRRAGRRLRRGHARRARLGPVGRRRGHRGRVRRRGGSWPAAASATAATWTSPDAPCAPPWSSGEQRARAFASYRALRQETAQVKERREEARRLRGEKASTRGKRRPPKSRKGKRG